MPRKHFLKTYCRFLTLTLLLGFLGYAALPDSFWNLVAPSAQAQSTESLATTPLTQLSMSGEPGDYIGGTTNHLYTTADGTFTADAADRTGDRVVDYVHLTYIGPGYNHWWYISFSTNNLGINLAPGHYDNAQREPFASAGHAGLEISGDGRGCNTLTGNFTVHEATFDYSTSTPRVLSFTATFEQHCEGGGAALLGTIYYNYSGGSAVTYSIGGQLADNNGNGVGNVPVVLSGSQTLSTMTDNAGNYSFPSLLGAGNFRVTPAASSAYVVSPTTQSVKNLTSNQTVNFTAIPFYSISGHILNSTGAAISGVNVALSGTLNTSITTDSAGFYTFTNLRADGNYTLTPSRTYYAFTPSAKTFNTLSGNQTFDFTGAVQTYAMSGRVTNNLGTGISGVSMNLSGSQTATTQTDGNGNYSFSSLTAGGTLTVTPSKANYNFSPTSLTVYGISSNSTNANFTGSLQTYTIRGLVLNGNGDGIGNALVSLTGSQNSSTLTDSGGNYTFSATATGNYTVTATKANYSFVPPSRVFNNLSGNQTGNFIGTFPAAGAVLISEFRFRGASGAQDEFVELANNTDSSIAVNSSDGSGGWALAASDGVVRFTIPNGTVIPAHGYYLGANSNGYTLSAHAAADLPYAADIADNAGIALFRTANPANFTGANVIDAVGFGTTPAPYIKGAALLAIPNTNAECSFVRKVITSSNLLQNTDNNASDFLLVATDGNLTLPTAMLGAPGPESSSSPVVNNNVIPSLVDPLSCAACAPNRDRQGAGNSGTLAIRRHFVNNTGATINQLRFHLIDITTMNSPLISAPQADLRLVDSNDVAVSTTLGALTVKGTQLEQTPAQSMGGGLNSSVTVALPVGGLGNNQSVDVQFLMNVIQNGKFRFYVSVEALP